MKVFIASWCNLSRRIWHGGFLIDISQPRWSESAAPQILELIKLSLTGINSPIKVVNCFDFGNQRPAIHRDACEHAITVQCVVAVSANSRPYKRYLPHRAINDTHSCIAHTTKLTRICCDPRRIHQHQPFHQAVYALLLPCDTPSGCSCSRSAILRWPWLCQSHPKPRRSPTVQCIQMLCLLVRLEVAR